MDLVLRNAQLHNGPRVDIAIEDGRASRRSEARFPGVRSSRKSTRRAADHPRLCQRPVARLQIFLAASADATPSGVQSLSPFQAAAHVDDSTPRMRFSAGWTK